MAKKSTKLSPALSATEILRLRARATLEIRNREMEGFRSFVSSVNPRYIWYRHCEKAAHVLERVASGELKRVLFLEPPRHGKSELTSRSFPAYYLNKYPSRWVGICSYSADIALGLSMDARTNYIRAGYKVHEDAHAKSEWRTLHDGGTWAAGVGGAITGRGAHLGIIDDPFRDAEEAYSARIREQRQQWYNSVFYTRLEPDSAVIVIATRWHEDDLVGYILKREYEDPQYWHVVNFPAMMEEQPIEFPKTCTIEPDSRAVGDALCPERFDVKTLDTIKRQLGSKLWLSLYQQRPKAIEGTVWKRQWFKRTFDIAEYESGKIVLSNIGYDWDLAYTEDEQNSACAFVKAGIATDGSRNIYVLDIGFEWYEFPRMIQWMANYDGPHYVEAKASGKSAVQTLKANEIVAMEVKVQGGNDKIGRSILATPAVDTGHVIVAKHLLDLLLDDVRQGLTNFPNGTHGDLNDAFVQMINRLWKRSGGWRGGVLGVSSSESEN